MKIGSLCSGYGGLDMAVEAYFDAETIWMSDNDKYASIVIKERWGLPNLGNLKEVDWTTVEPIDILTAGYPCQPFSNAGLRKGANDKRHIWPNIKEIISQLQPRIVILENVRGHLTLGFKEVLKDLTEIGYDARWSIVRASDVGAPHRRERLFVIAQPSNSNGDEQQGDRPTQRLGSRFNSQSEMRLQRTPNPLDINNKLNATFVEYMMGLPVGWVTDLDISRSQQLKLLGNGVVPQQAYYALGLLGA